jgi:flap endonuclease GEN
MEKIEQVFHLGRNKMIALALLCGCDYDDGLYGVGKEAALKLFKSFTDDEILVRYLYISLIIQKIYLFYLL